MESRREENSGKIGTSERNEETTEPRLKKKLLPVKLF